jgi:hypothetical protein
MSVDRNRNDVADCTCDWGLSTGMAFMLDERGGVPGDGRRGLW